MAGGTFTQNTKKVRPGVYVNVRSNANANVSEGNKGTVIIPFIGHDYGPTGRMINISASAPDMYYELLGHSVYDTGNANMLLVREALKNAANVIVWIVKTGTKATGTGGGLTATAKYGGTLGNKLSFAVTANALNNSKFDITVSLDSSVVSKYQNIANLAGVLAIDDPWIDFAAASDEAVLAVVAGTNLAGATAATATNSDVTAFLDSVENAGYDVILFPSTDASLTAAFVEKVKFLNNSIGKNIIGVVASNAANYEGVINVTNTVKLDDGVTLTIPQAAAWCAGASAAAECTESLTFKPYDGAVEIIGAKGYEAADTAHQSGEFFFSYDEGTVVVDADINSLVTLSDTQDESYKKNRVIRTINAVVKAIKDEFKPGKFDNIESNWDIMNQHGLAILTHFAEIGAIREVVDGDFVVDEALSGGDSTYFNVYIAPIDSAEKLCVTVYTN